MSSVHHTVDSTVHGWQDLAETELPYKLLGNLQPKLCYFWNGADLSCSVPRERDRDRLRLLL